MVARFCHFGLQNSKVFIHAYITLPDLMNTFIHEANQSQKQSNKKGHKNYTLCINLSRLDHKIDK